MLRRDRIVVFGDVIDDIVVVPRGTMRLDTDTAAAIRQLPGGSAANTAAWLGGLDVPVDFVGIVGRDDLARHTALMTGAGVTPRLRAHPTLPTGTIVVIVDGEHRTMLTERGANSTLDPGAVTDDLLDAAAILHLTGYSVVDSADLPALRRLIERATTRGVDVSVDPASAGYLADFGAEKFLDAVDGARLIFPNLAEGRALTGKRDPRAIAETLGRRFPVVALTLGADGAVVVADGSAATRVDAVAAEIVEPTGAGDAFCAGFLAEWTRSRNAVAAAQAGVLLGARAVGVMGGRPV